MSKPVVVRFYPEKKGKTLKAIYRLYKLILISIVINIFIFLAHLFHLWGFNLKDIFTGTDLQTIQQTSEGTSETKPLVTNLPDSVVFNGIDVSVYQNEIDWMLVKENNIKFVICKATQGISEVDPRFESNWNGAKEAGIIRGAYHFFDNNMDAQAQAKHFINTVDFQKGDLKPAVDVESLNRVSTEDLEKNLLVWLETVAKEVNSKPIIYSDLSFIKENFSDALSEYPLWIAFPSKSPPDKIDYWDSWAIWQHGTSYTIKGINDNVDIDVFMGTLKNWQDLLIK